MSQDSLLSTARNTIRLEAESICALLGRLDGAFSSACQSILACTGRVVVMGMGKSGHIANKIAATLASTGTPAYFVHPAEASHGDIGMVTRDDVVVALSNSGTTPEMLALLPILKRKGVTLIALTGNPQSELARAADSHLDVSVAAEACPLGLAPTTSTTAALVMGDALAMALLDARGFTAEDFAFSHPGGNLGRRLLLKVEDIMHQGNAIPRVSEDTSISAALLEVTAKKLGMTTVHNSHGAISGVFTDGDLRRVLDRGVDLRHTTVREVMTGHFKAIPGAALASEAARVMQDNAIYSLVVLDREQMLAGIITMHDLLKANVV
ncbi:MAG: KpsF/GutQ family sugar-phosphate isomerase [Pseudomonadales bacterium]|jgi:arabinose-5-phosphate isomerase|nr:KpsF/GutQ family sugar-phosphate isomerase [Pseudomonadales bacterium]